MSPTAVGSTEEVVAVAADILIVSGMGFNCVFANQEPVQLSFDG
jgi:hypothetical protein